MSRNIFLIAIVLMGLIVVVTILLGSSIGNIVYKLLIGFVVIFAVAALTGAMGTGRRM